jgi:tetratricopeptide (TPR) repeat protein
MLARRALEINARHPGALVVLSDIAWATGEFKIYEELLNQARSVTPRDEAVLGRLAALEQLRSQGQAAEPTLAKDVAAWNPKPGRFFYELALKLDERRHYESARGYYQKALELFPQLSAARTELGLLAMRLGDEEAAKPIVEDAFKADPFHVRLANSRIVLRHLEKYTTVRTEHFIIRFDEKQAAILGRILPDFLEAEYEKLAKQYDHRPTGPFIFELFNSHEMFSGRIIAAKDLHTIGATTGRVFALAGPRAKGVNKPYNWARVIRHELTHIFNLDQTRFMVPHWLTEGLAVSNEGFDRPAEWLRVLATRGDRNELFTLETIDAGLTRPKTPEDWTLAYCQAELLVDFLKTKFGPQVIQQLLAAYRDRMNTPNAIKRACGVDIPTIESEYRAHIEQLIKSTGALPTEKPMSLSQLETAHNKSPDDLSIAARLADEFRKRKRTTDARMLIEAALGKDPQHQLARFVKVQMMLDAGEETAAQELLETAAQDERPYPRVLYSLGKIYQQAAKYEEAVAAFERGRTLQPAEPVWLEEIARTARLLGDADKAIKVMQIWLRADPDELEQRRELARLAMEVEKYATAEQAAREAIEIDPADSDTQELLLTALAKQGKTAEVSKWEKYFGTKAK